MDDDDSIFDDDVIGNSIEDEGNYAEKKVGMAIVVEGFCRLSLTVFEYLFWFRYNRIMLLLIDAMLFDVVPLLLLMVHSLLNNLYRHPWKLIGGWILKL